MPNSANIADRRAQAPERKVPRNDNSQNRARLSQWFDQSRQFPPVVARLEDGRVHEEPGKAVDLAGLSVGKTVLVQATLVRSSNFHD